MKKNSEYTFCQRLIIAIISGIFLILAAVCGWWAYKCFTESDDNPSIPDPPEAKIYPLPLEGWNDWGGVTVTSKENTVTINGSVNSGGCYTLFVNTSMKNKTAVLEIKNVSPSKFSENRMIKITVNQNDRLVSPLNVAMLIHGEYIPSWHTTVEFLFPSDFDGKLGFVFTKAEINNLGISLYYKE